MTIRVLVVDDHPVARGAVLGLLDATDGVATCGVAADGRQGIELAVRLEPDVILMDVAMPDMSGIEATRRLLSHQPSARVLIFSGEARRETIAAAREAGAAGFVAKGCAASEVVRAIHAVMAGRSAWNIRRRDRGPSWALTPAARMRSRGRGRQADDRRSRSPHG